MFLPCEDGAQGFLWMRVARSLGGEIGVDRMHPGDLVVGQVAVQDGE
jgi:hypothetical protein